MCNDKGIKMVILPCYWDIFKISSDCFSVLLLIFNGVISMIALLVVVVFIAEDSTSAIGSTSESFVVYPVASLLIST